MPNIKRMMGYEELSLLLPEPMKCVGGQEVGPLRRGFLQISLTFTVKGARRECELPY